MFVPDGLTEAYVMEKIGLVAQRLAPNFVFGYHSVEDIRQEVFILCMDALPRYVSGGFNIDGEPKRKLENFLYTHAYNRLCNLVRNTFHRNDPPCKKCHNGRHHECTGAATACEVYRAWKTRNQTKANLMKPGDLEHQAEPHVRTDFDDDVHLRELNRMIDERLSPDLRSDYKRLLAGVNIPKGRKSKVEEAVRLILGEGTVG